MRDSTRYPGTFLRLAAALTALGCVAPALFFGCSPGVGPVEPQRQAALPDRRPTAAGSPRASGSPEPPDAATGTAPTPNPADATAEPVEAAPSNDDAASSDQVETSEGDDICDMKVADYCADDAQCSCLKGCLRACSSCVTRCKSACTKCVKGFGADVEAAAMNCGSQFAACPASCIEPNGRCLIRCVQTPACQEP